MHTGVGRVHAGRVHASDLCCLRHGTSTASRRSPSPPTNNDDPRRSTTAPVASAQGAAAASRPMRRLLPTRQQTSERHQHDERDNHDDGDHHDHLRVGEVLAGDDQCRSGIALGGAQREHASRGRAGTAEHPADAETDRNKDQRPRRSRTTRECSTMLPRCPAVVSTTTKIMLMLDTGATNALKRRGTSEDATLSTRAQRRAESA